MKKILYLIILLFLLTCSEDRNPDQSETLVNTRSSSNSWTLGGVEENYILGEEIIARIYPPTGVDVNVITGIRLQWRALDVQKYENITTGPGLGAESLEYRAYAYHLGFFKLRGLLEYQGEEISTEEYDIRVMGPHIDDIKKLNEVKQKIEDYWGMTLSAEESGMRQEYGFTLNMRVAFNEPPTYSFTDGVATVSNACGPGAVNNIRLEIDDFLTSGSGNYSIAMFHTHPPYTNCSSSDCRDTGPSTQDDTEANRVGIPWIVADYVTGEVCGGHSRYLSYKLYEAGNYKQRLF